MNPTAKKILVVSVLLILGAAYGPLIPGIGQVAKRLPGSKA